MVTLVLIKLEHAYILASAATTLGAFSVWRLRHLAPHPKHAMTLFAIALGLAAAALALSGVGAASGAGIWLEYTKSHQFILNLAAALDTSAVLVAAEVARRVFVGQANDSVTPRAIAVAVVLIFGLDLLSSEWLNRTTAQSLIEIAVLLWTAALMIRQQRSQAEEFRRLSIMTVIAYAGASAAEFHLAGTTAIAIGPEPTPLMWSAALLTMAKFVIPVTFSVLLLLTVNARTISTLQHRAETDSLTHLVSRGGLNERGERLIGSTRMAGKMVVILMIDIDHFKRVNDAYGHDVGDQILEHCAAVLQQAVRPDAMVARYGGEEFCAIIPIANRHDAFVVAERLRFAVQSSPCTVQIVGNSTDPGHKTVVPITVSIGGAIAKRGQRLDALLHAADLQLYEAKRGGRNRACLGEQADSSPDESLIVV